MARTMGQPFQGVRQVIRIAPSDVRDPSQLASLGDISPEKAQKKFQEVQKGAALMSEYPPLLDDEPRPCQDCAWLVLFILTVVATLCIGLVNSGTLLKAVKQPKDITTAGVEFPPMASLIASAVAGAGGSLLMAFIYVMLAHKAPACVVWTSLIFGPVLLMLAGLGVIAVEMSYHNFCVVGVVIFAVGLCSLGCVFCCYLSLIPFTIKLTEVVAEVIEEHPCLLFVSVIGSLLGTLWTIFCKLSFVSIYMANAELLGGGSERYAIAFVCTLIYIWGAQVANNICYVAYCGVYGRWYYHGTEGSHGSLGSSIKVALTTSFGSICFGSFLVSMVHALEAVARALRSDAQEQQNAVLCILAFILECIISCIGDVLEYFNEWAYVQCAVRGASFVGAARITFSLTTCSNVKYIISDLLLNSLVTLGGLLCAVVGGASGAAAGFGLGGIVAAGWGAILGFFVGMISGFAAISIISSGVKTLLACWADDPAPLQQTHPLVHQEFEARIYGRMNNIPPPQQH